MLYRASENAAYAQQKRERLESDSQKDRGLAEFLEYLENLTELEVNI